MITEIDGVDFEVKEQRLKDGLCPTCGVRLYKLETKGLVRKRIVRTPLTKEGVVERGQCKVCLDENVGQINDMLAAAAIASVDDGPEDLQKKPRAQPRQAFAGTTVYIGGYNCHSEREGKGELHWSNGDRYVGMFSNGLRHGEGTLYFKDGSEYVGNWRFNLMHGEATRRFQNGDVYTGNYVDGKRCGQGRFYFSNGDLYVGFWEEDKLHGFGRYYYSSGISYEGTFYEGKRQGKGKVQKKDGDLEIHRYDNNVRVDPGVRWSADRKRAWRLEGGRIKKAISIAEAVAIGSKVDAEVEESNNLPEIQPTTVPTIS